MSNPTVTSIIEQAQTHDIEFGKKYMDKHSKFEGVATAMYFFEHGCVRVLLRGTDKQTGAPIEVSFDAPELVAVQDKVAVPPSEKTGGPRAIVGRPMP